MGESLITAMKIALVTAIAGAFMVVLNTFINFIVGLVFSNVIGEVLGIISVTLPFNAGSVFGSIATAISAIGAFMLGSKIYALISGTIQL